MLFRLRAESEEFLHLDGLRFLAACGVVVHHYATGLKLGGTDGFTAFVDLFFIISGVVITHVYGGRLADFRQYASYLQRRVARLAPLHWAVLAFYVALWGAATVTGISLNDTRKYDAACIVPNILFVHAFGLCKGLTFNEPSWSISAEMGVYLIAPLLLWIARRSVVGTVVAIVGVIAVLTVVSGARWMSWTFDGGVLRALPSFFLGTLLYRVRGGLAKFPAARLVLVVTVLAFLGVQSFAPRPLLLVLVYVIAATAMAADQQRRSSFFVARFAALGQLTYSIYMLHAPVWTLFVAILGQKMLHLTGGLLFAWVGAAVVLLLVVVSPLSLFLFETPMRRLLSGKRRSVATTA